jgi:hypothetical protein
MSAGCAEGGAGRAVYSDAAKEHVSSSSSAECAEGDAGRAVCAERARRRVSNKRCSSAPLLLV